MPKRRVSRTKGAEALLLAAADDYRRDQQARADGSAETGITIARISAQVSARMQRGDLCPGRGTQQETE